jgi:hypothetical protein
MSIHRSIRLLASLVIACHASCSSSDAERHQGKLPGWGDDELILAAYRVEVDPLDPKVFSFYPLGRLGDPVSSEVGQVHGALANGDETVSVWYESDFAITNCAPGVCGCDEGQGDIPAWYQGDCYDEGYVDYGMGRVVISNSTSDSTFVDPALVLTNFDPPGAAVFQQPPETSGSCTDYRATRSASPYQGSYYLRYNDIGPSGCDKGYSADRWIVAADTPGTPFRFDAFLLVDRLDGGPAFDADIFSEPIERPAKPEVRTPGLSSTATAGETCTGVVSGRSVLCVAPGGGGSGTASAPFGSIQAAVNAASAGDLIQIAQGSYSESVTIETNALTLRGGFTGAGDFSSSLPSERVTTLTAPSNGTALSIILADDVTILGLRLAKSSRGLLVDQSNARIEHCLIEENESQGALEASGGNFELYYSVIRYNRTDEGPIGIFYGRATVVGNDIHDNEGTSYHGGALYIAGSQTYILGNLIRNNRSLAYGAGILIFDPGSRAVLAHNVVTGNQAGDAGSGVFIDDGAEALLVNELIYGNGCPRDGGAGLYVDGLDVSTPSAAYVVNSTIAQHECDSSIEASAMLIENGSAVKLRNSILWGNGGSSEIVYRYTAGVRASYTVSESLLSGEGNISVDPRFADPASGDFHLRSTAGRWVSDGSGGGYWTRDGEHSPLIDAGDPADGVVNETSPNGGRINIGAYGGTPEASRSN